MKELECDGEFFSDHAVQLRAPQLFHAYVGKLLPPELHAAPGGACHGFHEDMPLSERLLANLDEEMRSQQVAEAAAAMEKTDGEEQEEEEESEEEEEATSLRDAEGAAAPRDVAAGMEAAEAAEEAEDDEAYIAAGLRVLEEERRAKRREAGPSAAPAEEGGAKDGGGGAARKKERTVQRARDELLHVMRERFLRGDEGAHFDYAARCDNDPKYDDIDQQSRDAEDAWFDQDD